MPDDHQPERIADLLQALDEVREAARRVDRERHVADHRDVSGVTTPAPEAPDDEITR